MTQKIMTSKEKEQALAEALGEAFVLADIMGALADGSVSRDSNEMPNTWMEYLGECVFRVAQKIERATA